jgi:hypothetical protein
MRRLNGGAARRAFYGMGGPQDTLTGRQATTYQSPRILRAASSGWVAAPKAAAIEQASATANARLAIVLAPFPGESSWT